jgi:hypothetical protein
MALPQLNHKNVVRYFGCWAESVDKFEKTLIQKRVEKIKRKLINNKKSQFIRKSRKVSP